MEGLGHINSSRKKENCGTVPTKIEDFVIYINLAGNYRYFTLGASLV